LALAVLGTIGAYVLFAKKHRTTLDPETLCPTTGETSVTAVLLDGTDSLTEIQKALVRTRLADLKEALPIHGRIEVYTLGQVTGNLLRPEIMLCNPGRGSDVSQLTANPKRVEKVWRERFSERLDLALDRVLDTRGEKTSPLMESIQSVGATAFAGARRASIPKHLVIVSDMLQHTPGYSQYKGLGSFDSLQRTEYFRQVRPDLGGVDVTILYLRRPTRAGLQGGAHVTFWEAFFTAAGATLDHVVSI